MPRTAGVGTLTFVDGARPASERRLAGSPSDAVDDRPLAAAVAAGVPDALDEVFRRHGEVCYRLARRVTANATLAEDCVQEAFLGLWRRPGRFDPATGSLRSWLLAMTHHKAVDLVRRETAQQRRLVAEAAIRALDPPSQNPEESAWAAVRDQRVRAALGDLPQPQREALALAYYGGYTQQEIARMTGVPLGTVKTRTLAAMRRLRSTLAPAVDVDRDRVR